MDQLVVDIAVIINVIVDVYDWRDLGRQYFRLQFPGFKQYFYVFVYQFGSYY